MAGDRAVVLLSGGLDSATVLARATADGYRCHALSFSYGQRHAVELRAAAAVAEGLSVEQHLVVQVGLDAIGGSALTDDIAVPKRDSLPGEPGGGGIPVTYVPARNTVFLSLALGWAEVIGSQDIFVGVNAVDYSGYPDCRPEFIEAFEHLADLATAAGVEGRSHMKVHAPLMEMSKAEIVIEGTALGVDYSRTVSCYDPDSHGAACAHCEACLLRRRGFEEAGIADPTRYAGL
ncbi:MAG: 7-cyano-7-deazaguanine synthase QueC [Microthrixaceae bacterium]|nr:7-cyano-7-deazaguanine synthase QueC [Microthrixaceae bacterium]MCB1012343.1 7-cyano-7-deazaguanine synthase QueC [Microthrixaceae bacterium]MCO5321673.1 7-cyano-7-deazaguanine synthase QueC [Microthrixaceae bacterium]